MLNMPDNSDDFKATTRRGDPWYKRYSRDVFDGTRRLTLEQRAAYNDILDLIYMHGGPIPDDTKWMAHSIQCSPRKWVALKTALLDAKKITIKNGMISNPRAELELENKLNISRNNAEIATKREREKRENLEKPNEINKTEARSEHLAGASSESDKDKKKQKEEIPAAAPVPEPASPSPSPAALPSPILDLKVLETRLLEACNGSLDNPVNCMGLLNLATPQMWLANGCDLELDVIPALTAAGKKHHGKRIRDWNYFTGIVADAKAKRTAVMPTGQAVPQQFESGSARIRRLLAAQSSEAVQ